MFAKRQVFLLIVLSVFFWILATLYIHFLPGALSSRIQGSMGFVTTVPVAWLSVLLTRSVGRLTQNQLLPGVTIVGALAMMIDGVVLRWLPGAYSADSTILRLGAAWLLWGYGVSFFIALAMTTLKTKKDRG